MNVRMLFHIALLMKSFPTIQASIRSCIAMNQQMSTQSGASFESLSTITARIVPVRFWDQSPWHLESSHSLRGIEENLGEIAFAAKHLRKKRKGLVEKVDLDLNLSHCLDISPVNGPSKLQVLFQKYAQKLSHFLHHSSQSES